MGALKKVLGASVAGVAVAGVVFVVGMRRKWQPVLDAVRWSSRATKPLVLRSAGAAGSPTAVVRHVGRTTGRTYDTPVVAVPVDGGFVIALPYGTETDWLKNVLAAGRATVRFDDRAHTLGEPRVVAMAEVDHHFARKEQRLHRRFRVQQALVLRPSGAAT